MQSQSLKDYRWQNRVIIIVSAENDTLEFQKQYEALEAQKNALADRDIILLSLKEYSVERPKGNNSQIDGIRLRKELKIDSVFEGVILIGKDGGIKMQKEFHVEPQDLFDLIDSMPMRRSERKY